MSKASVCFCGTVLGLMLTLTAPAQAQSGLRLTDETRRATWPHWQFRLGLAASMSALGHGAGWQITGGVLLGEDHAHSGPRLGAPGIATASAAGLGLSRTAAHLVDDGPAHPWPVAPYVGIGYSGGTLRSGWEFSADLGLVGTWTGGLRIQRDSAFGTQGLNDLLREMRLTPLLQIGASYAF
jgi:hypothetical protein